MSIHSSLRGGGTKATGALRNVLKRHERVRHLLTQGLWAEGQTVFGLPKIKQTKMKARKAVKEKEAAAGEGTAAAATPPAA
jgi:small basic protein (TIGR04137 family)